jgi:uncharacterized membrane protein YbhN (UPF0104 family)
VTAPLEDLPPPEPEPEVLADGPPAAPTPRWRVVLRGVAGASVGLVVAALVMWKLGVKPVQVLHDVAEAPLWVVAVCVVSGFVNFAFQSLRWHAVMGPLLGLGYVNAYRAQVVGYMFNQLLSLRGGDLLRVQYLGRRTGKSRATILGTEVVDRWLDLWGWIPTVLILSLVTDLPARIYTLLAMFGGGLGAAAITMIVLTRRGYTPRPGSRFAALYASFRAGLGAFGSRRTLAIALLIAPLPWLWEALVIGFVVRGFGAHLSLAQAFVVLVAFNMGMVVPSPGAIGPMETGGTVALHFFGMDQSKAFAFMTVYHLSQIVPGVIAGVAVLVAEGESLFGKKKA